MIRKYIIKYSIEFGEYIPEFIPNSKERLRYIETSMIEIFVRVEDSPS